MSDTYAIRNGEVRTHNCGRLVPHATRDATPLEIEQAAEIERLEAELASRATPGWKLVPREPTPPMVDQGLRTIRPNDLPFADTAARNMTAVYRAMLSAAPSQPVEQT